MDLKETPTDSHVYPVLTLPGEITSEIFTHFVPVYPLCPPFKGLLSPIVLTHVCHHWRNIALATPILWKAVSLDFSERNSVETELLPPWLTRSHAFPISIHVYVDIELPLECAQTLVSHRTRWEYLQLHWIAPDSVSALLDGPMPCLRRLNLSLEDPPLPPIKFGDAPLLRSVTLTCITEGLLLPWRQLTSLTLTSVFPSECTPVLQQTLSLVRCELHLCFFTDTIEPDIHLPHLKKLVFELEEYYAVPGYLDSFISPALRSLEVPAEFLGSNSIQTLTSFISKSGCTLRRVHITGEGALPITSYREAFPSITQLIVD
ncbi:hypothetical protein C8R43DRAFT_289662 [Mycena crocata]|nr:hypothetical protein C8R43DRAFT_289662 [Mycena crocata]